MGKALGRQVGGDHYQQFDPQPVEVFTIWSIPYSEANAIKYLLRFRRKGGIQDLEKAIHYCQLSIDGRAMGWYAHSYIFRDRWSVLATYFRLWSAGTEMQDAIVSIAMSLQTFNALHLRNAIDRINLKIIEIKKDERD